MPADGMNKLSWPLSAIDPGGFVVVHAFRSRSGYGKRRAAMGKGMGIRMALAFRWENDNDWGSAYRELKNIL